MGWLTDWAPLFQGMIEGQQEMDAAKASLAKEQRESKAARQKMLLDAGVKALKDSPDTANALFEAAGMPELAKTANSMADVAETERFGTFKLPLVAEYKFSGTGATPYGRSQIFWNSWQKQLADPIKFDEAVKYFKNDDVAREQLASAVRKNEYALRLGNINSQTSAGVKQDGLKYIDLTQDYSFATKLFDDLGFQSVEDEVNAEVASRQIDFNPETEIPVMFNTGPEKNIPMAVSKDVYASWESMASRGGFDNVQDFVNAFGYAPGQKPADMSMTEFAAKQNSVLFKAAKIYDMGYGDMLANPARMNQLDVANLLGELDKQFGKNNTEKVQAISAMIGTPAEAQFRKVRKSRYSKNESRRIQAAVTGQTFIESVTGLKKKDFDEGFAAQKQAVQYLDRLAQLEDELAIKVGTGWTQSFAGALASFGIQVKQAGNLIGDIFTNNDDFNNLRGDTNLADLEATIKRVNPRIDLAKISEADAIRLTLAAKMARAVDPSGRLSNQDFEIQLRRLGNRNLSTPESIQAAIKVVRDEFAEDLQHKQLLKSVLDNRTPLTRQTAREVQAGITLRNLQGYVYGAKGTTVTQAPAAQASVDTGGKNPLEGFVVVPGLKTKNGGTVYYADGVYRDESGNDLYADDVIEAEEGVQ